jgi:hypothetical protein
MKPLLLTLLLATLCATGYGQTIKSLGYNTNGQVVYAGTNVLTFTNAVDLATGNFPTTATSSKIDFAFALWDIANDEWAMTFDDGEPQFNGTNRVNAFREGLGLGSTWLTNTNVTNFRTAIGLGATNNVSFNSVAATNAALTRTNLGLPLPALTNTSNVTMMRALAGSTNTNQPFSGNFEFKDSGDGSWAATVSNGIILKIEEQ